MELDFSDYNIPEHTKGALERYVNQRFFPGSFLTAVLTNNLIGAICYADRENEAALRDIVAFAYNRLPQECCGSEDKVYAWTTRK